MRKRKNLQENANRFQSQETEADWEGGGSIVSAMRTLQGEGLLAKQVLWTHH